MFTNKATSLSRQMFMVQHQYRFFGVLPKVPKVELTIRTPYRTLFNGFSGFTRLYVTTLKGQIAIGNKSIPRVYLLPPGEMKVQNITAGTGNFLDADSNGILMHTGGWLFVHE